MKEETTNKYENYQTRDLFINALQKLNVPYTAGEDDAALLHLLYIRRIDGHSGDDDL